MKKTYQEIFDEKLVHYHTHLKAVIDYENRIRKHSNTSLVVRSDLINKRRDCQRYMAVLYAFVKYEQKQLTKKEIAQINDTRLFDTVKKSMDKGSKFVPLNKLPEDLMVKIIIIANVHKDFPGVSL